MSSEMKNSVQGKKEMLMRVPELRFPDFQDGEEWRENTIYDLFNLLKKSEKVIDFDKEKVITVKLHTNGVVKNERNGTLTGGANYFIRHAGQFVFSKIDLLNGAFGLIPEELDGFCTSSDVPAFFFKQEESALFFINWLKANYRKIKIERTGTSSTLKRISVDNFLSVPILLPTPQEQQKIADCLSALDNVISLQMQKIDALQQYKKGLMQNLFPSEGETVPELRFGGISDIAVRNEANLSSICYMKAGRFISASEINTQFAEGLYPCYGGNGLRGFTKVFSHNGGFSIIGRQGALCGNVIFADGDFYATEHAIVATPKKKINNKWLFYCLKHLNLNQYATGQAQPGLSVNFLEKIVVNYPVKEKEQQKIAECLSSLDELITLEIQKLAALKTHKTGLMQQLFPSMDEVNA